MSKILVTGGAGFIGSHLTDKLLSLNHQVVVLDNLRNGKVENLTEATLNPNFKFIEGDILNAKTCEEVTANVDIVYHLACLGVRHSLHSPFENHQVNAEGSLNMLEASRKNNVKRFFYISTSEIYGDIKNFPIDEGGIPLPKTVYGRTMKEMPERLFQEALSMLYMVTRRLYSETGKLPVIFSMLRIPQPH